MMRTFGFTSHETAVSHKSPAVPVARTGIPASGACMHQQQQWHVREKAIFLSAAIWESGWLEVTERSRCTRTVIPQWSMRPIGLLSGISAKLAKSNSSNQGIVDAKSVSSAP